MATPLVVHGHFYQPPRENPWTGLIDPQPGAAPFHDWNERVHAECYRPNAWARVFDRRGRIAAIVNNYAQMSFDVGPTLLSWLEERHTGTYRRIIEADQGHRAMAQGYNHAILPLCNERDRRTQIAWGLADFRHRFGRDAQGLWLPETAADTDTLCDLIDAGVRFTVLAPDQAALDGVDTGRAWRFDHPDGSGRHLALFFYDGALSRSVAFDQAAATSEFLMERIARAGNGGLVHLATDGETYGHHVPFADRSLAFALTRLATERGFVVTSYQEFLDAAPPSEAMAIRSPSSWSCSHGVDRWRADCGCSTGGEEGWSQAWRTPLRSALDGLRDEAAAWFERRGGELIDDPWLARERYIDVILGRVAPRDFADQVAGPSLSEHERVTVLQLLEMQRNAMLMFTSCGWFFHDLAGIESVQVLSYAGRVIELMAETGGPDVRDRFLSDLARARSNRPSMGDGRRIFTTQVETVAAPARRIAAHMALLSIADAEPPDGLLGVWRVRRWSPRRASQGRVALATGRVEAESAITGERVDFSCCVLYLGGVDFWGALVPFVSDEDLESRAAPVWEAFAGAPLPRLLACARDAFPGYEFGLHEALPDGLQSLIDSVFGDLVERFAREYERMFDDHQRILELMAGTGYHMPSELTAVAEFTLSRRLEAEIESHAGDFAGDALARAIDIARLAQRRGWVLNTRRAAALLTATVADQVAEAIASPTPDSADAALALLDLATELGVQVDLERQQEAVHDAMTAGSAPNLQGLARRLRLRVPGDED